MKKRFSIWIFAVITLSLPVASVADVIKRASSNDVEMLLRAASGENSAFIASYIGESRGRAYIQYETTVHSGSLFSKKMKHIVYWLPIEELSQEQLKLFAIYRKKHEREGR